MVYVVGEENFLEEKVFLPPYPYLSKTLKMGFLFFMFICVFTGRAHKPQLESFRPPFSKGGSVKGEEPLSPVATGEIFSYPFPKRRRG